MKNQLPDEKPQPNNTPKSLYNPGKDDFTETFANEENIPIPYTIRSQEISTFPTWLANHLAKSLCHKIVMERGIQLNYEADYAKVMKEIEVEL